MSVPPKSEEDNSKSGSSESSETKRKPRTRSRLQRTKRSPKAAASTKSEAAPSAELPFEPAPAPVAEAPAPAPEPVRESAPPPAPEPVQAPAQQVAAPTESSEAPAQQAQPGGQGGYDDGGNQGGGQFQGGGKWKHRQRGKHFQPGGGKWGKPGGFQGGGGGKPPQPLPPKEQIIYGDLPDPSRFANLEAVEKIAGEIVDPKADPIWLNELYALNHADLTAFARKLGAKIEGVPNRKQLLTLVFAAAAEQKLPLLDRGYIDMTDRGLCFIVHEDVNYRLYPEDAILPDIFVKQLGLRRGHQVEVQCQAPQGNERCPAVVAIRSVMGGKATEIAKVQPFEELTPYYPLKRIWLEVQGLKDVSMRMVDIVTPIGFGQRGLIVAPPRTGKTILMQNMANSIAENSPEAKLIILLVDERPEEVTDFKRHCKGEVVSSTFDEAPESHIHCAEMVIEKARRLVEHGEHVIILLDSITRLARAYNALASNSGKIMSGGLEANALQKPKRFFGSARNIEGGGSLTIIGTALVDTGSRMDEIIFEEFKGTGNMELHLDRDLVNKRIFPAINIDKSGTRKEELIYHPDELIKIYSLRRAMQGVPAADSMDMLIGRLKKTKTNTEFLLSLNR
ncbi:transcription termination factor Rho [Oleiharenicola lentus]|jgi:transcription termination factor Rho|uniref:Transcription termination factor Rho n=1 Tax=Oleiharenicola lentus TaxID=2508720 RepID=A0A4Q1CBT2_9BACT|nr:transcription termination factor Rho [Oleiharenicola lentus]RXK56488.1 transcription termination factor Rho [Oleiharenicola lentus]